MTYFIRDQHKPKFGLQVITLWSGAFASEYEGDAIELPAHNGFSLTLYGGEKLRVECKSPRTENNYLTVDAAINAAIAGKAVPA